MNLSQPGGAWRNMPMQLNARVGNVAGINRLAGDLIIRIHVNPEVGFILLNGSGLQRRETFREHFRATARAAKNGNFSRSNPGFRTVENGRLVAVHEACRLGCSRLASMRFARGRWQFRWLAA